MDVLNAPDGTVAILRSPEDTRIHGAEHVSVGAIRATVRGEPTLYITPDGGGWYLEEQDLAVASRFRILPADGRPIPGNLDAATVRSLLPSLPGGSALITEHPNLRRASTFSAWVRSGDVWHLMAEPYGTRYLATIWGDADYDPDADYLAERLIAAHDVTILPGTVAFPTLTDLRAAA